MQKTDFVWYVDADRPIKGYQSQHVATVVIYRRSGLGGTPLFCVGVSAKHPRDKMPFVKSEGRRIATERARLAEPCTTLDETISAVIRGLGREVKDTTTLLTIDTKRLFERMRFVLGKCYGA